LGDQAGITALGRLSVPSVRKSVGVETPENERVVLMMYHKSVKDLLSKKIFRLVACFFDFF
jgi:hypothetical protein